VLGLLKSELVLNVLFVGALTGLVLAIVAENMQILAKYWGAVNHRVAGGYNLAMKIMVINRFSAVLYFMLVAFNIENGLTHTTLAIGLAVAVASLAFPTLALLFWLQRQSDALRSLRVRLGTANWPKTIVFASFLATSFNLLGLTVPWIAGAAYPDFRLTLANSSFVFNTVYSIIHVFYIEHAFARLVDNKSSEIRGFVIGVIVARLAAFIIVSIALGLAI
jgi:hypothetical protein